MKTNQERMIEVWERATADLNLEIVARFSVPLPSGESLEADLLLKHFGAEKGMLIFQSLAPVKTWADYLVAKGVRVFGYERPPSR